MASTPPPSMASKYYSNLVLLIILFITSLPLLCLMVYYEKTLEKTLIESLKFLSTPPSSQYGYGGIHMFHSYHIIVAKHITPEFSRRLILLCFLHLVPLHLLSLLSTVSTVVLLASKIQADQQPSSIITSTKGRLKSVLLTSTCALSLSTCALVGFLWFSVQIYTAGTVVYSIAMLFFLLKFLELSAVWNMSLVMSVLEEVDGLHAFSLAFYFNKGSERRGLLMMFVFFALGMGLRIPCLFPGDDDQEVGLFLARAGLLWVVHLVKWGACTWYYFDCKNRVLQKKADHEVGGNSDRGP